MTLYLPSNAVKDDTMHLVSELDDLVEQVMGSDHQTRTATALNTRLNPGLDWNGSFLIDDSNRHDFFDHDPKTNEIIVPPKIPIFPEDFPPNKKLWGLKWWGIVPPPDDIVNDIKQEMAWEKKEGKQGQFPPSRERLHPCRAGRDDGGAFLAGAPDWGWRGGADRGWRGAGGRNG
eukprot:CAMPEP_0172510352 /NCGR_PEP_ID=MMETSP1066-20121228/227791_1 /TAXON_ID=671091 /ORGANISM="Coscinodiscus wailesii, Strain CCMP2513" /LENGTH=174 /DNA_ID=CAMNT_0013289265 /DNA_START=114 /DNA_END=635 /DNA_ORIENTATION=-